jgi:hypothetical protein
MHKLAGLALSLIGLYAGRAAVAQQIDGNPPASPRAESISTGQSLADATAVLERRGVEFHEGGFAFAAGDPDRSNLFFQLDEEHTHVCLYFSKSRQVVTGISMVFFPGRQKSYKTAQSWLSATRIDLFPDSSYGVQFSKPRTPAEIREAEARRPKPQSPSVPDH